jgi:hypothetical protein
MDFPGTQDSPQVLLAEGNQVIEAFAAERPEDSFTVCIRHRRLDRRSEDPDTHGRHGRIQPR